MQLLHLCMAVSLSCETVWSKQCRQCLVPYKAQLLAAFMVSAMGTAVAHDYPPAT